MATQNYFVMTSAQRTTAMSYNNMVEGIAVDPRAIDSLTPGSGINTNQDAIGFDVGDPIPLIGMFTCPVRVVNDPQHHQHTPDMIPYLLTLPCSILENETIYLPPEE